VSKKIGAKMKYKPANSSIITFLMTLFLFSQITYSTTLIPPSDSKINYYGRIDLSNPSAAQYGWSGVIIEARFTGPLIGMKIDHSGAYYLVQIDENVDTLINVKSSGEYIFSKKLSDGVHTVRIKLRSEDHYSIGSFQGLVLADGKQLNDPPPKPLRKIEFIGDSYTAGYGIESPGRECTPDEVKMYTNVFKTFTIKVTEAFHAQNIILGWSGAGMVRNYNYAKKRSDDPFPFYYDRSFGNANDQKKWNFSQWKPDLVVICLGTNDYSTTPTPDDSMYVGDYHKFINRILTNYTDIPILCVSTGDATMEKNVKKVVSEQKTTYSHSKVYFAAYPTGLKNEVCHWHPTFEDNKNVTKILVDTIMKRVGWDTATATTVLPFTSLKSAFVSDHFQIREAKDAITINTCGIKAERISFVSLNGKEVFHKYTDTKGMCSFSKHSLQGESFVIGSKQLGWRMLVNVR
jgi:lysophospholipase L1-like esterase